MASSQDSEIAELPNSEAAEAQMASETANEAKSHSRPASSKSSKAVNFFSLIFDRE